MLPAKNETHVKALSLGLMRFPLRILKWFGEEQQTHNSCMELPDALFIASKESNCMKYIPRKSPEFHDEGFPTESILKSRFWAGSSGGEFFPSLQGNFEISPVSGNF